MIGDATFLSRKNTSLVAAAGAIPRFYPKKNVTLRAKGSPAWKKMLCVLLWILGVILAFGIRRYAVGGSALLALSGLLLILAVYLKGL
ncbi:MAG: hypothetical protein HXS48_00345 [Theionarchaea archaeon]|nr:hypothetical protein [Theionarchaea archaeon]